MAATRMERDSSGNPVGLESTKIVEAEVDFPDDCILLKRISEYEEVEWLLSLSADKPTDEHTTSEVLRVKCGKCARTTLWAELLRWKVNDEIYSQLSQAGPINSDDVNSKCPEL